MHYAFITPDLAHPYTDLLVWCHRSGGRSARGGEAQFDAPVGKMLMAGGRPRHPGPRLPGGTGQRAEGHGRCVDASGKGFHGRYRHQCHRSGGNGCFHNATPAALLQALQRGARAVARGIELHSRVGLTSAPGHQQDFVHLVQCCLATPTCVIDTFPRGVLALEIL